MKVITTDCLLLVIVEKIKEASTPVYRPPIPQQESEGVHPAILTLMKHCWAEEPAERPSFNDVAKTLKTINKGKLALILFVSCILVHNIFKFAYGFCCSAQVIIGALQLLSKRPEEYPSGRKLLQQSPKVLI